MMWCDEKIIEAIRQHAIVDYPYESCGLIYDGAYHAVENVADNPLENFAIDVRELIGHEIQAIVHSHPDGPAEPTATDMRGQIDCDVAYGIVVSHAGHADRPFFWGGSVSTPELIGRDFRHGPSGTDGRGDCYALIRDYYLLEKGITLPEFPRDNDWWTNGGNLYENGFKMAGFKPLPPETEPQVGDVGLILMPRQKVVNHGCIYVGDGLILHHLYGRLSGREPVGRWLKYVVRWLRYEA